MPLVWYIHKCPEWGNLTRKKGFWLRLEMPESGEPDFYRQARSFSAFFQGRSGINHHDGFFFTARPEEDFEDEKMLMVQCGADAAKVEASHKPVATCNDIWEFYEYIGFDYKTRKYRERKRDLS
jgi:hypothetical protein